MKLKRSATIRDVARLAEVSTGTVSRALTDRVRVAPATRRRVLAAVAELQYRPHPAARSLSTGRTHTVAVLVPVLTWPQVAERLHGAVSAIAETPFDLVVQSVVTLEQRQHGFQRFLSCDQVDGVLVVSLAPSDEEAALVARADIPVVLIGADHKSLRGLDRIVVDDVGGGRTATEHLLALGHTRLGFVGDAPDNPFTFSTSRDRFCGFREALASAGLMPRREHVAEGPHCRKQAQEMARAMLVRPERPTAIVAASDTQAFGVLAAARDLGLRVPEDVSVTGHDDVDMAEMVGLTTVRQPLYESGRVGMRLLLDAVSGSPSERKRRLLPTELVVRRTTGPPAARPRS
jgi:DNA-binding LacI/PurR family transcriptional regulator